MITVDISEWAAVATILGVGITVLTVLSKKIDSTRTELKDELGEVRTDIRFLTQRTIDFLAHPPEPHAPARRAE